MLNIYTFQLIVLDPSILTNTTMMSNFFRSSLSKLLMGRNVYQLDQLKFSVFCKKNFHGCSTTFVNTLHNQTLPSSVKWPSFNLPGTSTRHPIKLPSDQNYIEIFDSIPLSNINLPSINETRTMELPTLSSNLVIQCKGGLIRIRKKKMNKHKLKKRRKRDRAKIRKVLMGRDKQKRKKRAKRKIRIQEKIEKLLEDNPKCTYAERPYVIHRLKNW